MTELTGREIKALMRRNNATIRQLAKKMDITLKRIREVRLYGIKGAAFVRDWTEGITREEGQ